MVAFYMLNPQIPYQPVAVAMLMFFVMCLLPLEATTRRMARAATVAVVFATVGAAAVWCCCGAWLCWFIFP